MSNEAEALNLPEEAQEQSPQLEAVENTEESGEATVEGARVRIGTSLGDSPALKALIDQGTAKPAEKAVPKPEAEKAEKPAVEPKAKEKKELTPVQKILKLIGVAADIKTLKYLAFNCQKAGLVRKEEYGENNNWRIMEKDKEGSKEIVRTVIKKKFDLLVEKAGPRELEVLAFDCHEAGLIKKINTISSSGSPTWRVEPMEGDMVGREIVKAIAMKKAQFSKERRERKEQEQQKKGMETLMASFEEMTKGNEAGQRKGKRRKGKGRKQEAA